MSTWNYDDYFATLALAVMVACRMRLAGSRETTGPGIKWHRRTVGERRLTKVKEAKTERRRQMCLVCPSRTVTRAESVRHGQSRPTRPVSRIPPRRAWRLALWYAALIVAEGVPVETDDTFLHVYGIQCDCAIQNPASETNDDRFFEN